MLAEGVLTVLPVAVRTPRGAPTGPRRAQGAGHDRPQPKQGPSTEQSGTKRASCQVGRKRWLRTTAKTGCSTSIIALAGRLNVPPSGCTWKTRSRSMRRVLDRIQLFAAKPHPIFLSGEPGVGKDALVKFAHAHSPRSRNDLCTVNCPGLASTLTSALFGYVKGAFTGAVRTTQGLLHSAHGGNLHLAEALSLPLDLQGALLNVLDDRSVAKVGATHREPCDFRLFASSRWDPGELIAKGGLLRDYLERIAIFCVEIPPLRERMEDLPALVETLVAKHTAAKVSFDERLSECARKKLLDYHWPGNVRELEAVVLRADALAGSRRFEAPDIELNIEVPNLTKVYAEPACAGAVTPRPLGQRARRRPKWSQSLLDKARMMRANGDALQEISAATTIPTSTLDTYFKKPA